MKGAAGRKAGGGKASPGGGGGGETLQAKAEEAYETYGGGASDNAAQLESEYKEWAESLSEDSIEALRTYQGSAYRSLNKWLRGLGKENLSKREADYMAQLTAKLDVATSQAVIRKNTYVYRGVTASALKAFGITSGEQLVGMTLLDKGFMSTSVARSASEGFAGSRGVTFRIKLPRGSKAAVPLAATKSMTHENEIILPRGTKIRVTGYHQVGNRVFADAVLVK